MLTYIIIIIVTLDQLWLWMRISHGYSYTGYSVLHVRVKELWGKPLSVERVCESCYEHTLKIKGIMRGMAGDYGVKFI